MKNGKCKNIGIGLLKHIKILGKVEISSVPYDVECGRVSYNTEKEKKFFLVLNLKSQKF